MPKEGKYYITETGEDLYWKLNEEDGVISGDMNKAGYGSSESKAIGKERDEMRMRFYILDQIKSGAFTWPDPMLQSYPTSIVHQFEKAGYIKFVSSNRALD